MIAFAVASAGAPILGLRGVAASRVSPSLPAAPSESDWSMLHGMQRCRTPRARIVPALAATPSDISRGNAHFATYANNTGTKMPNAQASFAAYANNTGTQKPIVPTGHVPRAIRGSIRRLGHPIVHTTSAARAVK
jgi:hypothetical protein